MSKRIRRILSLIFALVLLCSLALPAAAAEGTISAGEKKEEPAAGGSISAGDAAKAAPAAARDCEIYVSASGDDMADGSREHPLATLAQAAQAANAAAADTVYVILLSDLTVGRTARFIGKNVILMSDEDTAVLTRAGGFEPAYDGVRGAYNPAMIELGMLQGAEGVSSLSLDNVVLDDAGLHEGAEFLPAAAERGEGESNLDRVQDAIVAVYGSSVLTLNPGSELRNFGGLSAVHATGSAVVTVEDGSAVMDTVEIASPAGLRAILAEGAAVQIGTQALVLERGLAAAPAEETDGGEETGDVPETGALAEADNAPEAADDAPEADALEEADDAPEDDAFAEAPEAAPAAALAAAPADVSLNGEEDGEGETPSLEDMLGQLMDLINNGSSDFSLDQLRELFSDVPSGQLQELLSSLTGEDSSGAGELIDQLADLIGGDNGSGDDLIGRLRDLIAGGEEGGEEGGDEGGDTNPLEELLKLLGGDFSPEELAKLLEGFSPEQLSGLLDLITGGGSGADIGSLFSNMAGVTGIMSLVSEPEVLANGDTPYEVLYTLTVNLPDTLVRVITLSASQVSEGSGQFTMDLDPRLIAKEKGALEYQFASNIFKADSVESPNNTDVVVKFSLKDGWKDHLTELKSPIVFQCTGVLDEKDFAEGDELLTAAKLDSLAITIGGRTVPGNLGEVGAEVKTKMVSGEGAMLTYDINGGEGGPDPNPVFVNAQTGYVLEDTDTPTHADVAGKPVVFLGWTAEKDSKIYARGETAPETIASIDVEVGKDQTVYAVYGYDENGDGIPDAEQKLVELRFDANGGSGAPDPILAVAVVNVGASIDIPEQEPSREYYTFQGWSKEQDATTGEYKHDAQKKADRDILITKDTVLYAVWKQNPTYTLYYNANGGSGAPAAQSGIADSNDTVVLYIASGKPTRSGYSFLGWSSRRSGSAEFFAGDKVNISGGNVTLYAVWQKGGSSYGGGGSGDGSTSPKTGDESPIVLYAALAVISLGAVGAGAWLILRKQKKK